MNWRDKPATTVRLGLALACLAVPALVRAQAAPPLPRAPDDDGSKKWSGSAELALYVVSDDENYLAPSASADRGWIHLEARYNYEDRRTASFWAGVNLAAGERVRFEITPMFGVVTGDTDGVAPGFLFTLSTWKLALYTEGEWILDTGERTDSFYYSWTELTVQATSWLRAGLVTQKTRAYETARYVERGILTGVTWKQASLTGHVFEPFSDQPTVVIAIGVEF